MDSRAVDLDLGLGLVRLLTRGQVQVRLLGLRLVQLMKFQA